MAMENLGDSLKKFWTDHESKIVLAVGLVLVAVISFEFGYMRGKIGKIAPMVIEKPIESLKTGQGQADGAIMELGSQKSEKVPKMADSASNSASSSPKNCAFVGSKNSDKFYPPSCSYAKRIKPENVVCFATAQEALSQGRTQSTGCAK
jgi:hypothetical protein